MRTDDSDAILVRAAQDGDKDAFALLLTRHRPLLLAICRRRLGDAALAEDAAQEAALQALLHVGSLQDAGRFGPWLAGIGLNVCRMWLRARARESRSREALHEGQALAGRTDRQAEIEARADAADLAARVRRAVDELPDGQRSAVQLFYLSGLTYAQTASRLGIEIGAVRTRLHKARGSLRRHLWAIGKEEGMTGDTATAGTRREYTCSFCGKKNAEVARLIAGPNGVAICNECVDLCNQIIDEAVPAPAGQ